MKPLKWDAAYDAALVHTVSYYREEHNKHSCRATNLLKFFLYTTKLSWI